MTYHSDPSGTRDILPRSHEKDNPSPRTARAAADGFNTKMRRVLNSYLWTVERTTENLYVCTPQGDRVLRVLRGDLRFARMLARVLNTTPHHRLDATDEEMDQRGVPRIPPRV